MDDYNEADEEDDLIGEDMPYSSAYIFEWLGLME